MLPTRIKEHLARHKRKPFALFPFAMTLVATVGMAVFALLGKWGVALSLGIATGGLLFVRGTLMGGRLGNARRIGQARQDNALRLGACLALAGMAAGAQGHDPPPAVAVRAALGLAQISASLLALGLAWRSFKRTQSTETLIENTTQSTHVRDDIPAPL